MDPRSEKEGAKNCDKNRMNTKDYSPSPLFQRVPTGRVIKKDGDSVKMRKAPYPSPLSSYQTLWFTISCISYAWILYYGWADTYVWWWVIIVERKRNDRPSTVAQSRQKKSPKPRRWERSAAAAGGDGIEQCGACGRQFASRNSIVKRVENGALGHAATAMHWWVKWMREFAVEDGFPSPFV